jgi:hypothetical protein
MIATVIAGILAGGLFSTSASASSAEELNIYSPAVDYLEKEVEYRSFISGKGAEHEQGYAFSASYSPTPFLESEVYEVLHKDPRSALVADSIELENKFQLAPQGRFWADPGLLAELAIPQQAGNPGEVQLMPILEKQFGLAVMTLNLPFEWQYGPGYAPGTTLRYTARAEYLLSPYFSPAVEAFGEPGEIGRFNAVSEQSHSVGPAFYGQFRWGNRNKLKYSVAVLFGLTDASPDWMLVPRLEFEF